MKAFFWALAFLVGFYALGAFASIRIIDESEKYLDDYAGEDFPNANHSNFAIPSRYKPFLIENIRGYSGVFVGIGHFSGDRRFSEFFSQYKISIAVKDRATVSVDWNCQVKNKKSIDWMDEYPVMKVKNAKYGPHMVWGDMYFVEKNGDSCVTRPFLALFVIDTLNNNQPGLLLVDRREGNVFLGKQR